MSSRRAEARPYSLTRRLATRFAVTTCALVLLYALLSTWFVVAQMRQDLLLLLFVSFLDHLNCLNLWIKLIRCLK